MTAMSFLVIEKKATFETQSYICFPTEYIGGRKNIKETKMTINIYQISTVLY